MKKTAGFLRLLETISLVFQIIGTALLALVAVFLAFAGKLSEIAAKYDNIITISGSAVSPAELDALKPFLLAAIGIGIISLLFTILGTIKLRKVYAECKDEQPFSDECVDNLHGAARLQLIGGAFGIVSSIIMLLWGGSLTVNGSSISSSGITIELNFIVKAVTLYLLYHIAAYGRTLENR